MNNNNTMTRLIVMIIVMANSISMMYGYNLIPYTEEEISMGISAVALIASEIWNHYKNNNYTTEAKLVQRQLNKRKGK